MPPLSWEAIGLMLGLSSSAVVYRAVGKLGMVRAKRKAPGPDEEREKPEKRRSVEPIQPGDPASWDLINKGTVLEGVPFRARA